MISVHFQGELFNITVIQVYDTTTNAKEAEVEWSCEDPQDLLELKQKKKKKILFLVGDWNAKVGIQEIPEVTVKFSLRLKNQAGQSLTEFCQENALVIANSLFQEPKKRLYTGTSPHGQYQNQIVIFFAAKHVEALCSQ